MNKTYYPPTHILGWMIDIKAHFKELGDHLESIINDRNRLLKENTLLQVYKIRYMEMQERYLNESWKFGEVCGRYFDDHPIISGDKL